MGKGKSIAGLILGIAALLCAFNIGGLIPFSNLLGLPIAIVGLSLSASAGKSLKANNLPHGLATAGLVIGIIAVVLTAIFFVFCGICDIIDCVAGTAGDLVEGAMDEALGDALSGLEF